MTASSRPTRARGTSTNTGSKPLRLGADLGVERGFVGEGVLVVEEHLLVRDGDDVVVEGAGVDGFGRLAGVDGAGVGEPVLARDGLAGFERLARGKAGLGFAGLAAVDENLDARRAGVFRHAHVVGCAFVGERVVRQQGGMDGEALLVRHQAAQRAFGLLGFEDAVEHRLQIGDGGVEAAVGAVGAR